MSCALGFDASTPAYDDETPLIVARNSLGGATEGAIEAALQQAAA
jgi:hypothetical protein